MRRLIFAALFVVSLHAQSLSNQTFKQPAAGAATRTGNSKLADIVNILDFTGAVCDAVYNTSSNTWTGTDNSAAFQAAIGVFTSPAGGQINVPAFGVCGVSKSIVLPFGVSIRGQSQYFSGIAALAGGTFSTYYAGQTGTNLTALLYIGAPGTYNATYHFSTCPTGTGGNDNIPGDRISFLTLSGGAQVDTVFSSACAEEGSGLDHVNLNDCRSFCADLNSFYGDQNFEGFDTVGFDKQYYFTGKTTGLRVAFTYRTQVSKSTFNLSNVTGTNTSDIAIDVGFSSVIDVHNNHFEETGWAIYLEENGGSSVITDLLNANQNIYQQSIFVGYGNVLKARGIEGQNGGAPPVQIVDYNFLNGSGITGYIATGEYVSDCGNTASGTRPCDGALRGTQAFNGTVDSAWVAKHNGSGTATITAVSNANPMVVTAVNSFANGDTVYISGVLGNTAANGIWKAASVSGTGFTLAGSGAVVPAGNGAYTSGGVVSYPNWAQPSSRDFTAGVQPMGQIFGGSTYHLTDISFGYNAGQYWNRLSGNNTHNSFWQMGDQNLLIQPSGAPSSGTTTGGGLSLQGGGCLGAGWDSSAAVVGAGFTTDGCSFAAATAASPGNGYASGFLHYRGTIRYFMNSGLTNGVAFTPSFIYLNSPGSSPITFNGGTTASPNIITLNNLNFGVSNQGGYFSVNSAFTTYPNWVQTSTSSYTRAMFNRLGASEWAVCFGPATTSTGPCDNAGLTVDDNGAGATPTLKLGGAVPAVTVTAGSGLSGGGAVALGGSVTLSVSCTSVTSPALCTNAACTTTTTITYVAHCP